MNTLLVFDYATTGSDPTRDGPVEFACVRLDMDLNMVGSPTSLHCKPSPDHLPDPAASLMSRITPQLCEQVGLPELRFVNEVHRLLGSPGTISFGYASIAFDDEVTRFMLWRNLIDPYAREWKNGCGRWDLIELVRATYALRPETLEWPRDDQGNVCFGLEPLTVANGLLHESAHDTLSNVYATIELARLLRDRQPRLYSHVFAMHDKSRALQEMNAKQYVPFVHVGADATTAAGVRLMIPIAPHPTNRNEVIAWDLSKDPRQLLDIDAESIRLRLFTPHERRPEDFEPMPLYAIAANRSPAVFNNLAVLSPARALELGIDTGAALANVPVMLRVLDAWNLPKLLQVVYTRDQVEYDAEQALYDGFLGSHDRRVLDHLRMTDPAELASVKPAFDDPRLDELFLRYKARHYPETLSQRELDKWEEHRYRKLITGYAGSRTVAMVRAFVAHWRIKLSEPDEPHDPAKLGILDDVQAYTDRIAAVIDPYEVAAPAPPETAIMDPARATPSDTIPVQPDLFGDGVVAPPARSIRPRRR